MIAPHPFERVAIEACDRAGHPSFAWVSTWGDRGFEECTRCGVTRWVGRKKWRDMVLAAGAGHSLAGLDDWHLTGMRARFLIERANLRKQLPPAPRESMPKLGRRPPNPERDAAIVAALADGASVTVVALANGLTPARVYQIRDRARREGALPAPSGSPVDTANPV